MKSNKKQVIKLTESDLHKIIENVLLENGFDERKGWENRFANYNDAVSQNQGGRKEFSNLNGYKAYITTLSKMISDPKLPTQVARYLKGATTALYNFIQNQQTQPQMQQQAQPQIQQQPQMQLSQGQQRALDYFKQKYGENSQEYQNTLRNAQKPQSNGMLGSMMNKNFNIPQNGFGMGNRSGMNAKSNI